MSFVFFSISWNRLSASAGGCITSVFVLVLYNGRCARYQGIIIGVLKSWLGKSRMSCLDGLFITFYQFVIRSFVCRLAGSAVALSYFSLPFFFCLLLLCCSFISVYLSLCLSLCLSVSLSFFYNLCFSFSDLCPSFVFFPQNSRSFEFWTSERGRKMWPRSDVWRCFAWRSRSCGMCVVNRFCVYCILI